MKKFQYIIALFALVISMSACQKGNLENNPNVASSNSLVPPSLILNRALYGVYQGGGVVDSRANSVFEGPWDQTMRWNQYTVSNLSYYRGNNSYNWANTATAYDILKYVSKMEAQAATQFGSPNNVYGALGKFLRAYCFIWLTQRVGDIPMTQAGDENNLTPTYDSQHDVYRNSLALLDTANTMFGSLITSSNANTTIDGDIYALTVSQWQKVVNTYRLRVLISLSKRADDNADLNIKSQFATILGNPTKYPVMTSNADNLTFKFNSSYNQYPRTPSEPYNLYENIGNTYLNITTATKDPRTFVIATPAPAQLAGGKTVSDFTAYVGADISKAQSDLNVASNAGTYSFVNYKRYFASLTGPEPYIMVGYPEMCFNIAEAINRGWVTGADAATWYNNGINASLSFYGLADGQILTIGDLAGKTLGTVTVKMGDFLTNPAVVYKGNNNDGLTQILNQKYVAMFENSGIEAFYNFRRTGVPVFAQNGPGINGSGVIPRRWQYPTDEKVYNEANCTSALQKQFGGSDDLNKDMWLIK